MSDGNQIQRAGAPWLLTLSPTLRYIKSPGTSSEAGSAPISSPEVKIRPQNEQHPTKHDTASRNASETIDHS